MVQNHKGTRMITQSNKGNLKWWKHKSWKLV